MTQTGKTVFKITVQLIFWGFLAWRIVCVQLTEGTVTNSPLINKMLLSGKSPFHGIGSEYTVFKSLVPQHERVSYISDRPFNQYDKSIQNFYAAQSALVPILLDKPGQRAAIVDCSNSRIADMRMRQEGYLLLRPIADGKAVAIKKS